MTSAATWESSVGSDLRNLRRAGVLKKRSRTVMVVPAGRPASSTRRILPPAISMRVPEVFFGGAGFEVEARDAGDGGQGFAAEAEGSDGEQVVGGADFGGGVALEGEEGVVADHAVAVVGDADEFAAAGFDFDADAGGSGVEGVFEELFDDGGGRRRLRRRRSGWPPGRRECGCGPWMDCRVLARCGKRG